MLSESTARSIPPLLLNSTSNVALAEVSPRIPLFKIWPRLTLSTSMNPLNLVPLFSSTLNRRSTSALPTGDFTFPSITKSVSIPVRVPL